MPKPRLLILALLACLLLAAPVRASELQESIIMDDSETVYASEERLDENFARFKALGADRVRISVYWRLIAPSPEERSRPDFRGRTASDPAGYPADKWDRYDAIVRAARRHDLKLLFSLTSPVPRWAAQDTDMEEFQKQWVPDADGFRDFAAAVGTRYSGSYADENAAEPLPRVDFWSIWNEPNQPGWLAPQTQPGPGDRGGLPLSPHIYRGLLDGGYNGLAASGHGADTILMGELAPRGLAKTGLVRPMRPLIFVRELFCIDRKFRRLRGERARVRGCPTDAAGRASFAADHPGLFRSTGIGHHPYALEIPPGQHDPVRDHVVLADLSRLTRTFDRAFARYGVDRRLPLYVTEYGYQTNPPDPTIGVDLGEQVRFLAEADYRLYRNPRVQSTTQFLLVDDRPRPGFAIDDPRYWGSFQSGLLFADRTPKPIFFTYPRTIHVTPARAGMGRRIAVFGQLRQAANGPELKFAVQFRAAGSESYVTLARRSTSNPMGFAVVKLRAPGNGTLRLLWDDPAGGDVIPSRGVRVRFRR